MSISKKLKPILSIFILIYSVKTILQSAIGFGDSTLITILFLGLHIALTILGVIYWATADTDDGMLIALIVVEAALLTLTTALQIDTFINYQSMLPRKFYLSSMLNIINIPLIFILILTVFISNQNRIREYH